MAQGSFDYVQDYDYDYDYDEDQDEDEDQDGLAEFPVDLVRCHLDLFQPLAF